MIVVADSVEPTPVGNGVGGELGSVVTAEECRRAAFESESVEHRRHVVGGAVPSDLDSKTLSGEQILDVEELEGSSVARLVELEVERPDGVRDDGAHRPDRRPDAAQRTLARAVGDLQILQAPEALHTLSVHAVALAPPVLVGALPPPARVLARERHEPPTELPFVVARQWAVQTLRRTVLADDSAGSPLGHPERLFERNHRSPTGVRGQNFPSAMCLSMSLSSAWSATIRFSRRFSFSSSFSRLASLAFIPPY